MHEQQWPSKKNLFSGYSDNLLGLQQLGILLNKMFNFPTHAWKNYPKLMFHLIMHFNIFKKQTNWKASLTRSLSYVYATQ